MMRPLNKLMIWGLNELVANGLIRRTPTDDEDFGHFLIDIVGRSTAVIWRDIGCGELRISVWFDLDISRHPQANLESLCRGRFLTASSLAKRHRYSEFVGATVSCWFERERGPRIQGTGRQAIFQTYIRRDMRQVLAAISEPVPMGFTVNGRLRA